MLLRKIGSRYLEINASLRMLSAACGLALLLPMFPAGALAQCHFDPGNPVCIPESNPLAPAPPPKPVVWAALAISDTTLRAGASHGQTSEDSAQRTALDNCRRQGALDCKLLTARSSACIALAISVPDRAYGFSPGASRVQAASSALEQCRSYGGKNCTLVVSPCASDDPHWSSPLPLPTGTVTTSVDAAIIGTWALTINPGRWVWEIGPHGTYEFHSEAPDAATSHSGTFTASDGHWTLQATNGWSDGGTYSFEAPGIFVATGRLGTGTWRRVDEEVN